MASLVLAMAAHALQAQARPDFSGEWTRVDSAEQRSVASVGDAAFRVGNMGSGLGSPLTLRQDANRLVVEYTHFGTYDLQPKLRFTYALDGSESRNPIMIGHAETVLRSRAMWQGDTLVILTFYDAPTTTRESAVRLALVLEEPNRLVIDTQRTSVAGAAAVVRTRYAKR